MKEIIPRLNIFFLPKISAIRPNGTTNMADARLNAVATQPSDMASIAKSVAIWGNATLIELIAKDVIKTLELIMIKAKVLSDGWFIFMD